MYVIQQSEYFSDKLTDNLMEQTDKNAFYHTTSHIYTLTGEWSYRKYFLNTFYKQKIKYKRLYSCGPLLQAFVQLWFIKLSIKIWYHVWFHVQLSYLTEYQEHRIQHKLATATFFKTVLFILQHSHRQRIYQHRFIQQKSCAATSWLNKKLFYKAQVLKRPSWLGLRNLLKIPALGKNQSSSSSWTKGEQFYKHFKITK